MDYETDRLYCPPEPVGIDPTATYETGYRAGFIAGLEHAATVARDIDILYGELRDGDISVTTSGRIVPTNTK